MKATAVAALAAVLVLAACKSTKTPEQQQAAKEQAAQQEAAKQEAARKEAAEKEAARLEAERKKQAEEDAKYAPKPDAPPPHVDDYVPSKMAAARTQPAADTKSQPK